MNKATVERLIIIDEYNCKTLDIKNLALEDAVICLDEYMLNKCNITKMLNIWTCRIGLHNFPDLKPETKCKECGLSVLEVRKLKGGVTMKNIIMHLKMNLRRYDDLKIEELKRIIDKEYERRVCRDTACVNNSSKAIA